MTDNSLPIIRVPQWLPEWENKPWSPNDGLPKPNQEFYIGSMPLGLLRTLAGVSRRTKRQRQEKSSIAGYQRQHERDRSERIGRYIQYGYPLSTQKGLDPDEYPALINPGWLPTSIIVNVLPTGVSRDRYGKTLTLENENAITLESGDEVPALRYPVDPGATERLSRADVLEPLEIIDGQHRVFGADSIDDLPENYCVPVVFFFELTLAWQAYLFWVINVEPKKINTSLAFDLYPELRDQSWLQESVWIRVYQQHRAQELTEILWRNEASPWHDRIELHGQRIDGRVSNAAFIRALTASYVRRWQGRKGIGGLFGSIDKGGQRYILPWKRAQQAALLIDLWQVLHEVVSNSDADWARAARRSFDHLDDQRKKRINPLGYDAAFAGPYTLLATDQGVRAVLSITNALFQLAYSDIGLDEWQMPDLSDEPNDDDINFALGELASRSAYRAFLFNLFQPMVKGFDWRTSKEPGVQSDDRLRDRQSTYRGSSGYKKLLLDVLFVLREVDDPDISEYSKDVYERLN